MGRWMLRVPNRDGDLAALLVPSYWREIGTDTHPIFLRHQGKWVLFGNGLGGPLELRDDNQWKYQVSREGLNMGIIHGQIIDSTLRSLPGKLVVLLDPHSGHAMATTFADNNGYYSFPHIPFDDQYYVRAFRLRWEPVPGGETVSDPAQFPVSSEGIELSRQDPMFRQDIFFPKGERVFDTAFGISNPFSGLEVLDWPLGWKAEHNQALEFQRDNIFDTPAPYDLYTGDTTNVMQAYTRSWMGDVPNSIGLRARKIEEKVGWYSIPVGLAVQQAIRDGMQILTDQHVHNPPYSVAEVDYAELLFTINGHSWVLDDVPGGFRYPFNAIRSNYLGVGAVRMQSSFSSDVVNIDWPGIQNLHPGQTFNVVASRDEDFERSGDGVLVWAGDLNDSDPSAHNGTRLSVTQPLDVQFIQPDDTIEIHIQASPLPDPPAFDASPIGSANYTVENYVECTVDVVVHFYYH